MTERGKHTAPMSICWQLLPSSRSEPLRTGRVLACRRARVTGAKCTAGGGGTSGATDASGRSLNFCQQISRCSATCTVIARLEYTTSNHIDWQHSTVMTGHEQGATTNPSIRETSRTQPNMMAARERFPRCENAPQAPGLPNVQMHQRELGTASMPRLRRTRRSGLDKCGAAHPPCVHQGQRHRQAAPGTRTNSTQRAGKNTTTVLLHDEGEHCSSSCRGDRDRWRRPRSTVNDASFMRAQVSPEATGSAWSTI